MAAWTGRVVFSSAVAGTGALGLWQLARYDWKKNLIASRESLLSQQPVEIATDAAEFTRVRARGVYNHDREVLVGPRSPPPSQNASADVKSGWLVITPFMCDDHEPVLVNRGWVPRDETHRLGRPAGSTTIEGIVRAGESPGQFTPANDVDHDRYFWIDVPTMALTAELFDRIPLLVEATKEDAEASPSSPWPLQAPLSSFKEFRVEPQMHLVYSGTWLSLSLALGILTFRRFGAGATRRR